MTPAERRTAVGRLSATLALRPDAERVRGGSGTGTRSRVSLQPAAQEADNDPAQA